MTENSATVPYYEFNLPENSNDLVSFIFDEDIAMALHNTRNQIDNIPKNNVVLGNFGKELGKAVATVEALNKQAQRNQVRTR